MRKTARTLMALTLALALCLPAPALAAESASVIRLEKTTGTVSVCKSSGKAVSVRDNLRLSNGYQVATKKSSYAWLNLDDSKLLKESANSKVEIRKNGKLLEVNVWSGSVFFDVSQPLESDESLNIRTSTTVVGIRGTSGWVEVLDKNTAQLTLLEGRANMSVTDPVSGQTKSAVITGGQTADSLVFEQEVNNDRCDIVLRQAGTEDIPGYVLDQVLQDVELLDKIKENGGPDITQDLAEAAGLEGDGRNPDGSVREELLDQAQDRVQQDEQNTQTRLDQVEQNVQQAEEGRTVVSDDKALTPEAPSGGGDSGGSSGGATTITATMPQTAAQVQALLNQYNTVTLQPSPTAADNTLDVNSPLTVPGGKTLTLENGVSAAVEPGATLRVDGTMTADNLWNNGHLVVTSNQTLRVRNVFQGDDNCTLQVTDTGKVVVGGIFSMPPANLTLGNTAQVLAKSFDKSAPDGWQVSSIPDANGLYSLLCLVSYTITFDANGGKFSDGATTTTLTASSDGYLTTDIPETRYLIRDSYTCTGWFTDPTGGEQIDNYTSRFTADTTVYAHWTPDTYTVTFNINGGAGATAPEAQQVAHGSTATEPDDPTGDSLFDGWCEDPAGAKPFNFSTPITADITLYAKWVEYKVDGTTLYLSKSAAQTGGSPPAWASEGTTVTAAVLPNGITRIGNNVFQGYSKLTSVNIPSTVKEIDYCAFASCSALTSVNIPEGVTSIGEGAFGGCSSLTSVTIPEGVTSIGAAAFSDCTGLTSVTIPGSMIVISEMCFMNCSSLESVSISEGVTNLDYHAFLSCRGLKNVTIPSSMESIYQSFDSCTQAIQFTYSRTANDWKNLMSGVTCYNGWTASGSDGSWKATYNGTNWVAVG